MQYRPLPFSGCSHQGILKTLICPDCTHLLYSVPGPAGVEFTRRQAVTSEVAHRILVPCSTFANSSRSTARRLSPDAALELADSPSIFDPLARLEKCIVISAIGGSIH